MKSEEGKGRTNPKRPKEENLRSVAMCYLKTMLLLERGYGISYLIRIVKGTDFDFWKSPDPREFETFGQRKDDPWDHLRHALHHMVGFDLIAPRVPDYNVLEITDKGRAWMDNPQDILVRASSLSFSVRETKLRRKLNEFRQARARQEGFAPYEIFTDYTLDRLVIEKPSHVTQLAEVPGMSLHRAELYGAGILSVIAEADADHNRYQMESLKKSVKSDIYQQAKRLMQSGASIPEMIEALKRAPSTVYSYIENLATAGEFNPKTWIEKQVDGTTLFRGSEYFQKTQRPTLTEAFRTLGIDYDLLRLCRIYARCETKEEPLKASA